MWTDPGNTAVRGDGNGKRFERHVLVIGAAAFVTAFSQMETIGLLPVRFLLKGDFHITMEEMSLFMLVANLGWYLKPVAGLISDSIPLFGTRRRHYLMLSAAGGGICWAVIGLIPRCYFSVLLAAVILNLMLVFASTVMGGLLVEDAHKFGAPGRLSSLREGVTLLATSMGIVFGGYLATSWFGWVTLTGALPLLALALIVYLYLQEKPSRLPKREDAWVESKEKLSTLFHSDTLMTAGALLFLFYLAPGFSSALYYIQTDTLKFTQKFIGWQAVLGGVAGMVGTLVYARACKTIPLRLLLICGIALSGACTLFYIYYQSRGSALLITASSGLLSTFGVLPLFDLATRATPKGCESLGFALMMSVRNLAVACADWIGSWLMQYQHWNFSSLVIINAATTLLVLAALPFLPRTLLTRSETELTPEDR